MTKIIAEVGRIITEGYVDFQQIRIGQFNRIRDVVRRKEKGIPYVVPEAAHEERQFTNEFNDAKMLKLFNELVRQGRIAPHEAKYLQKTLELSAKMKKIEGEYYKFMIGYVEQEIIWTKWLKNVKGIGPNIMANLLNMVGYCEEFRYPSSLRRYAGQDPDGASKRQKGVKFHYNPKMKNLVWKITDQFIKNRTEPYRTIYDTEKAKELMFMNQYGPDTDITIGGVKKHTVKSRLQADFRAKRKMATVFLTHYWLIARLLKNLEITKPYPHDRLGHQTFIMPSASPFTQEQLFGDA